MLIFACDDVWQQAAEMLDVEPTAIKNIHRNLNITRWPYRKVRLHHECATVLVSFNHRRRRHPTSIKVHYKSYVYIYYID